MPARVPPRPAASFQQITLAPAVAPTTPRVGERGAVVGGEVTLTFGHDPPGFALEYVELFHDRLDGGHDLGGRRSGADHGDDLARQVVGGFPARGVELGPLEVGEPGPVRVAGNVEETDRAHDRVAFLDAAIIESQLPHVPLVVPGGRLDRHTELYVGAKAEFVDCLLEVVLQLGLPGVRSRPVVRLEREAVQVRADIDLRAGIGVVPPGAADPER